MTTITNSKPFKRDRSQSQMGVAMQQLRKNPLARFGGFGLILFYLMALFAPFIAPDGLSSYSSSNITKFHPPTPVHLRDPDTGKYGTPFVYKYTQQLNMDTFVNEFQPTKEKCPIRFFVKGDSYRILGIPGSIHLFGTGNPDCKVYLFGAETLGRDLFTRIMYASQISLTIGLGAVVVSTLLGLLLGGIAAYFGGWIDTLIMRLVEVIGSIPGLFLIVLLRAALPQNINPILGLYVVIFLLALINWGGMARSTRAQLMSVRELDFASAAKSLGASDSRILWRHLLPTMTSYVIIGLSLGIPGMILFESSLSFIGIGAVEPYVSWGSLLSQAQEGGFASITQRPWVLIPGLFIVFTVMCFQLLGDGLRDAFDPRRRR